MAYPEARRSDFKEELHGVSVPDPYRWMEEDSDELSAWTAEQNTRSAAYVADVSFKEKLRETIKQRLDYPKHGIPFKKGSAWYYYYNTGLQNHSVLYKKKDIDDKDEKAEVFLDPNQMSEDGTTAMEGVSFTEDGRLCAYGLKEKGSDWCTIHVKNCETGEKLPDIIEWVNYSYYRWTKDNKGFLYGRFPALDSEAGKSTREVKDQRLVYHVLGTSPADDAVVYYDPKTPTVLYDATPTHDGKAVVITSCDGTKPENLVTIIDLEKHSDLTKIGESAYIRSVDEWKHKYDFVGKHNDKFFFITTDGSPNNKLVYMTLDSPKEFKDAIPEQKSVLEWASIGFEGALFTGYLEDVKDVVYLSHADTPDERKKLDIEIGSVGFSTSRKHSRVFYSVTSFTFARRVYDFRLEDGHEKRKLWYEATVPNYDSSQFEVKQEWFASKDGTKVPMFIIHKKGLKLDGNNPTVLYVYGGFHVSLGPAFSTTRLSFISNMNGVYCLANIRGGSEYGEDWWKGGSLRNKKNCVYDTMYAAKYLVEKKYTRPEKLAIEGGSNGGLVVAAVANEAPELFGAVVSQVPVMDITRFHKFTIGSAWTSDFGNP
eukprot:gene19947-30692_t